ncbi:hypothetical protein CARUB_v10015777mg [Capsella rubella]|uniref:Defensin-like domain-containing protein n=1 Tax=Capsella rubella TaxID=81985 RepID=R0GA12_9BRAS|nr:hypothetical protein CARUB_v10015777mg [Capsella rubella]
MDISKTFATIFLVLILTISFSNSNISAKTVNKLICAGQCLQFYGNLKCDMECKQQHYHGGVCDYTIKGPTTPLCCCFNDTNPLSPN